MQLGILPSIAGASTETWVPADTCTKTIKAADFPVRRFLY
jgi:hypothetical protein